MINKLLIYNTLSRSKEVFEPLSPPHVGLYVCGPTVYGDPHLGHARPYTTFDVLQRYFTHIGYKVRYVRNITDVGHLENDADVGEDKIGKKARLEKLEPMEVVERYTGSFHQAMRMLNNAPPSIEPRASGHIIEQIEMVKAIISNGFAYEANGSVYFDVPKYAASHDYGKLSGRVLEDLVAGAGNERRELEGQEEKRNPADFALWKKAQPEHIMRWPSPWGEGFPGWHIECSAMSTKYLGETFDIHGGGMDLLFPHHESEIAQSKGSCGKAPVRYWMHNNMITINGQKMGKSLGNFITLTELFTGNHKLLEQAYSPMSIRFFILQAQYRSTLDFSNDGLLGAEKAYKKLMASWNTLQNLSPGSKTDFDLKALEEKCYAALNDDLNTPIVIAEFFDAVRFVNSVKDGKASITADDLAKLKQLYQTFLFDILGLLVPEGSATDNALTGKLIERMLDLRAAAKAEKNFAMSDRIRNELSALSIVIKDTKDGTEWSIEN